MPFHANKISSLANDMHFHAASFNAYIAKIKELAKEV